MDYLEKLEYKKILEELSKYCKTTKAKELIKNLRPCTKKEEVIKKLQETNEAVNIIYRSSMPPKIEYEDEESVISIKNLKNYGTLPIKSLLNLSNILKNAEEWKTYFYQEYINPSDYPILETIFSELYINKDITSKIMKSINSENMVEDNASKNLSTIRRNKKNTEQDIKQKLNNLVHSSKYSKYIQESIVTIRNDRYVIPVKEEYRGQIKGFIHDISSSGSTIFIEPISIFELNNKINQLKIEENIEIEKILQNLTKLFYPYITELEKNLENLSKLDFIFAKAKYSRNINGKMPKINNEKYIILEEAKHPLIDTKKVVPTTIKIGKDYQTLIITGPNTGGKTVTLKTVGLLVAMACSGLNIPAKNTSSIYVFENIFADIGDDQSIADSLSTFSAHMTHIVDIVNRADENSLILVDELGSGTDPIEGQALAISILENLKQKGALTIATSHYEELKKYALVTKGFENASVDFDVETLTPTYHLLIGVPGKSNAFAISKKLGLTEEILKKASQRIGKEDIDFEKLIKNIYNDKKEIEIKKEKISKELEEIEKLKQELETKNLKKLEEEKNIIQNAKIQGRNILLEAKEEANQIIKSMQEINKNESKKANELRNRLNKDIKEITKTEKEETKKQIENSIEDIKINTIVWYENVNQEGTVISKVSKDNQVQVQFGSIKMNVPINKLKIIKKENKKAKNNGIVSMKSFQKSQTATTQLNVIGLNVDEAIFLVDKFLDDSSLAKLSTVRIIHGKGTGKLRIGIQNYLKKHPHVKSFRVGTFGEGEMGVTVVEIK